MKLASFGRAKLKSRIAATTMWSGIAVAASAVTGVFTARTLGAEGRGSLALALSVAGLCVLVGALGTNVSIRRHLPRKEGVSQRGYERVTLLLFVPVVLVLIGAALALWALVDPVFGQLPIGLAFVAYGIAYYLSNQLLDLLNATGRVVASARTNAIGSIACAAFVAGAALLQLGLIAVIYCYVLSVCLQIAIALFLVMPHGSRGAEEAKGTKILVADGVRMLGLNLGQSLTYRSDTVLLGALSTPTAVGMYAVAVTPAAILRLPANAMGQVAMFESAAGGHRVKSILKRVLLLELVLFPLAIIGWLLADWAITFVFGDAFSAAVEPFRILLIAELALAPFLIVSRALAGGGSRAGASLSGICGVAVLIGLSFVLIPTLGATGAAWASVAAYSAMSIVATGYLVLGARKMPRTRIEIPS